MFLWRREILNSRPSQWWRLRPVLSQSAITTNGTTAASRSTTTRPAERDSTQIRNYPTGNRRRICSRTWDSGSTCIFCRRLWSARLGNISCRDRLKPREASAAKLLADSLSVCVGGLRFFCEGFDSFLFCGGYRLSRGTLWRVLVFWIAEQANGATKARAVGGPQR